MKSNGWSLSKRQVLEIFNMNYKNVITRFLFLNQPPISHQHLTYLLTYQHNIYTLNVKENEFFMCAKFIFSAIIYAKVIGNNSFSTGDKPLSPRP